jgi:hypothetical protein
LTLAKPVKRLGGAFVPSRSQLRHSLVSSSALDQDKIKEDPDERSYNFDRRRVLGACLAPLVLLPAGALSTVTEVEPDLDCLLDLPPVANDHVRLYLCRHGQTENNRLRKVQGARVDPPINDNGTLQATNFGKALARADPCPEVFFSSNLQQARMTADIAARQVDPKIKTQQLTPLAEVDFGPVAEGHSKTNLHSLLSWKKKMFRMVSFF